MSNGKTELQLFETENYEETKPDAVLVLSMAKKESLTHEKGIFSFRNSFVISNSHRSYLIHLNRAQIPPKEHIKNVVSYIS